MRFLENMISGMVKQSTGVNPRRLVRMVGGKNILLAGGVALAGALASQKSGGGGGGDATSRWTGGKEQPRGAPPPPPPGAPPAAPPPDLPPIPGSRPDGMEGDPPPVETLSEEAARDAEIPQDLLFAIVRTMVAAALADGHLADAERAAIEEHLDDSGLADDEIARVRKDLVFPASVDELAALTDDPQRRRVLYRFAVLIVQTDEDVNDEELAWLDRLAGALDLSTDEAAALRRELLG